MLTESSESEDQATLHLKQQKRIVISKIYGLPSHMVRSLLQDLPVARPQYTEGGNTNASMGTYRLILYNINSNFTQIINSAILEESLDVPLIVFSSRSAFRQALECYLSRVPSSEPFTSKTVSGADNDLRPAYLKKLEGVAANLGSTVTAAYKSPVDTELSSEDDVSNILEILRDLTQTAKTPERKVKVGYGPKQRTYISAITAALDEFDLDSIVPMEVV
jgi:HPt (histidine-containing phosphotransfer) domain-containing protein